MDKQHKVRWLALLVPSLGMFVSVVDSSVVSVAISVLWVLAVIETRVGPMMLLGPLFLFGLSIGLAAAQLNTVIMSDIPLNRAGDASAAKSAIARVGNSFGAAFVSILIVISINDVLIMVLIFISIALAFTLPNVKSGGGERNQCREMGNE